MPSELLMPRVVAHAQGSLSYLGEFLMPRESLMSRGVAQAKGSCSGQGESLMLRESLLPRESLTHWGVAHV